ncbi:MAG: hypothetical protein JST26_08440 [Bacteroidetes bacterium]|nr:hypothetical protein [Bacteroidota bacterium]
MEKVENAHIDWAREQDVTAEEILASDEFKHLSEVQAKEVVEFVRTMSTVFYSLYKKQYESEIEIEDNETNNNYEPIKNAA